MKNCLVIGRDGKFGSIFAGKLAAEGLSVEGIDVSASREERESLAAASDCIVLCVPEAVVIESIPLLAGCVKPEAVIVDIASVKSRIGQAVSQAGLRAAYLSIHPMFGPLSDFEGKNIGVVPLGGNADPFIALLQKWGARLTTFTAAEHDRTVAYVQAMTHAAILQMGAALRNAAVPWEPLSTPVHTSVLALCARIVTGDPSLYWDIQTANPFAAQARDDYANALADLSEMIRQSDYEGFKRLFADLAFTSRLPSG